MSTQRLYTNVHGSFVCNRSKLETTQTFTREQDEWGYTRTTEYYSAIKMSELLMPAKTWMNVKITMLSEKKSDKMYIQYI